MVLLELIKMVSRKINLRIGVVHVDHGIRGSASSHDAQFVLQHCKEADLDFFLYELNLNHHTSNLEELARERRYTAIMDCKQKNDFTYAATGHTKDDQAETIIYRLIRGSGMRGLSGMTYKRDDGLIRPLLSCSSTDIERFALHNHIAYVSDETNQDLTLARNLIRHEIIPLMKRINPSVVKTIANFSRIAREENTALDILAGNLKDKTLVLDWKIVKVFDWEKLKDAPHAVVKRLIIQIISDMLNEPRGLDSIQIEAIMDVLQGRCRSHSIKRRLKITAAKTSLVFNMIQKRPYYDMVVEKPGRYHIDTINRSITIEYQKTKSGPLRLRSYLPGDRLQDKRVVKLLADHNIIEPLRVFWPILLTGDNIVSVGGIRDTWTEGSLETIFPYA